jgi:hypothetical protein
MVERAELVGLPGVRRALLNTALTAAAFALIILVLPRS